MRTYKKLALNLIPVTIALIMLSVILNFSLLISFLCSISYSILILSLNKFDVNLLIKQALENVFKYRSLYITIFFIGATVAMWLSSGVISSMIYYGFNYIEGVNFLFFSFIIVTLCSVFMGTAVGTFSTIGLILYSIGSAIGIPPHILIGTIVSGSFVSDKISPLSGLVNINLNVSEIKYNTAIRSMLKTLIPSFIITSVIYIFIGKNYIVSGNMTNLLEIQISLQSSFFISPWLLLFPVFIIALSTLGVSSLSTVGAGVFIGSILTITVQDYSISSVLRFLAKGFELNSNNQFLDSILHGGGVFGMIEIICIVISAVFLVGIFEKSGIIEYIIGSFIIDIKCPRELIFKTALLSSSLTMLTCDQTVGIVLPGNFLKSKYDEFGIERGVLSRTISDSGIVVAPIFPWNLNYIIITSIIPCSIAFVPYSILCFVCPIVTLISSMFIKYKKQEVLR